MKVLATTILVMVCVLASVFIGSVIAFGVIYGYLTHTGAKSSYSAWCGLTQANVCDVYSDISVTDAVAGPMHVTTWGVMQPFGKSTENSVTESDIAQPVTYNNGQVTANAMFIQDASVSNETLTNGKLASRPGDVLSLAKQALVQPSGHGTVIDMLNQ